MNSMLADLKKYLKKGRTKYFSIDDELFSAEKRRHLKNISLPNGKFLILPIDQGLEHGPIDFLDNIESGDPEFQLRLAVEAGFSAIALQIGLAKKYWQRKEFRKNISLVLKLNGKTCIPGDALAFSPLNSTVEEAYKMGADAVGYTLFVGSPKQDEDLAQIRNVRMEAEKFNLPLIVWSYPRGQVISDDGGKDSLGAVDYAVRVAMELGADIVKFNLPSWPKAGYKKDGKFAGYNELKTLTDEERLIKVVQSAGRLGTLLSGGDNVSEKTVIEHAKLAMKAGVDGLIFGRNIWQRKYEKALDLSKRLRNIVLDS